MSYTRNYGQPCKKYCEVRKKYSGFGRIVIGMYFRNSRVDFFGVSHCNEVPYVKASSMKW